MTRPLVIVGPTACGKSALGLGLAQRTQGAEIVSADAMAVYRHMTVGTAKASPEDRLAIPHHMIDVVEPTEDYTLSLFSEQANTVITKLRSRDVPIVLVGGTGLYVQAVVDGFNIPPQFSEIKAVLEADPNTEAMWLRLKELDPAAAGKMERTNRRRVIRALEVCLGSGEKFSSFGPGVNAYPETDFILVGLHIERDLLDKRIDARYDAQMKAGFLAEVKALPRDLSRTAAQALGYKELLAHIAGELSLEDALDLAKLRTKKFARRQQRWFRRDPRIQWFDAVAPNLGDDVETWWAERR